MKSRAIIPMVLGLAVGGMALKVFMNVLQKAQAAPTDLVSVVYASTDIEPTLEILDSMVEVRHVSKGSAPETGFGDASEVVGRVTTYPIPKGTPIAAMLLAPKGTPPGMAVMIEEGFRAVAVKIDESAGVAGWIKPGSRVDVIAMLSNPDRSQGNQSFSKLILQNVEVLAVGQDLGKTGDTAAAITRTVTLSVAPADVPRLHLAETKGKLRLAMRGQRDTTISKDQITTDNDLLGTGSAGKSVAEGSRSSILESLLAAQAKVGANQTDKDFQPRTATVASEPQPWTVDVYKGLDDVETVRFEQKSNQWRRVSTQERRSSPQRRSKPTPAPVSLFAPVPPQAVAASEVKSN